MSRLLPVVLAALLLLPGIGRTAWAQTGVASSERASSERVVVGSEAEFGDAVRAAGPAGTIALRSGDYGELSIDDLPAGRQLRIVADDPASRPVVRKLVVSSSHDVTVEGLRFTATGSEPRGASLVEIRKSQGVSILASQFIGAEKPSESGVRALTSTDTTRLRIADSSFGGLDHAVVIATGNDIVIEHNRFERMGTGNIAVSSSTGVTIDSNRFLGLVNETSQPGGFVRFSTRGTSVPSRDIRIRYNVMTQDTAVPTMGIFMGNEADKTYENVVISHNIIIAGSPHGITVSNARNVSVEDNVIIDALDSPFSSGIRMIKIAGGSVTSNLASGYARTFSESVSLQKNSRVPRLDKHIRRALATRVAEGLAGEGSRIFGAHSLRPEHRAAGPRTR